MSTNASDGMNELSEQAPQTTNAERQSLSEDDIFHVLQNERRRLVLKYLEGRDGEVRMRDIAEQVAAWEHDTTVQALTSTQRQRVYIPLYQNHLTKLDDKGIIEYNQSRGIVKRTPLADELQAYLDPFEVESDNADAESDDFPWELPYFSIAGLGTVLLVGKAWSLPLLSMLSNFLVSTLILVLFSATSAAQVANERGFRV
ncbi:DUF7344 domain-containing protein [Halobellus captivus]|uniref:DUF7344 domain-containing protein n=1 Tax=Halobellus captivus TaxID=2592614 RepID=UPI00119E08D3|nr:hypothetical protein [Halobellus captivus]